MKVLLRQEQAQRLFRGGRNRRETWKMGWADGDREEEKGSGSAQCVCSGSLRSESEGWCVWHRVGMQQKFFLWVNEWVKALHRVWSYLSYLSTDLFSNISLWEIPTQCEVESFVQWSPIYPQLNSTFNSLLYLLYHISSHKSIYPSILFFDALLSCGHKYTSLQTFQHIY